MQHDEKIAIFQNGNRQTSLNLARVRLDATPIFNIFRTFNFNSEQYSEHIQNILTLHIQNISHTLIYEAREASCVWFDVYLHSVALSHFYRPFFCHSVVAYDTNVAIIHVALSATASTETLRYRFRCHTRFAKERLGHYFT